jgi:hypothetical protein
MVIPGAPPDDDALLAMVGPVDADAPVYVHVTCRTDRRSPTWGMFVAVYPCEAP